MSLSVFSDEHFMQQALNEAEVAFEQGEIPIGAVVVSRNRIIARAHNLTERLLDVTAHAEMQAITAAANHLGAKYLTRCTLYVTLEPCNMCAGALYWSQVGRIVFGAADEKRGFRSAHSGIIHPKTSVSSGILAEPCQEVLQRFFAQLRSSKG